MTTRIEPTRSLIDPIQSRRHDYVPASHQETRGVLANWAASRKRHEPTEADWLDFYQWVREET